jgi:hypothetical protein
MRKSLREYNTSLWRAIGRESISVQRESGEDSEEFDEDEETETE